MNTAIAAPLNPPSSDHYDPDEVVPRDSPLLQPTRVSLRLSPSPPPHIPLSQVKPSQGDAVLISFMDGGKDPTIAALAGTEALPSDISDSSQHGETEDSRSDFDENDIEDLVATKQTGGSFTATSRDIVAADSMGWDAIAARGLQSQAHSLPGPSGGGSAGARASINTPSPGNEPGRIAEADHTTPQAGSNEDKMAVDTPVRMPPRNEAEGSKTAAAASKDGEGEGQPRPEENTRVALQSLAAGALGALSLQGPEAEPEPERTGRTPAHIDIALTRRIRALEPDMVATPSATLSPYSSTGVFSPRQSLHSPFSQADLRSPLPPIQGLGSPRSDTNSLLPSIREQLGDINSLGEQTPDGRHSSYAHSSPGLRLPGMPHGSPPISPNDMFRTRPSDMPSPSHPMQVSSPYAHYQQFNSAARNEYSSSATETPSTDQSTPSTTITDRMSIDGITNPLAGSFVCKVPGCTAAPFQTQYLLNSHANVHSSARPHYCPKKGCPRSEGGKGFKRKNEMIRHGLVHDSPGYVCPFCPDREHKYPRPDNLQRHVRVHHMDKEKDDPMLRDVLSQRPDGPSRGRRKRGPI